MRTWILLPAFNEAENLPRLLENIAATFTGAAVAYTVLIVNDGSTDATAAVARDYESPLCRVVSHEHNRGLARTVDTGIRSVLQQADGEDVVVTMDADNSHSPALIIDMLEEIRKGADLVIASRFAPGGLEEGVPLARRVLSHGIGLLMHMRFGLKGVRDYSCGYRAYRSTLLRSGMAHYGSRLIESRGFTVMAELLVKMQRFQPKVTEVPLHLRYDLKRGRSKMRLIQTIVGYLQLLCSNAHRLNRQVDQRQPASR